jgi:Ca2+:H+ antiporter
MPNTDRYTVKPVLISCFSFRSIFSLKSSAIRATKMEVNAQQSAILISSIPKVGRTCGGCTYFQKPYLQDAFFTKLTQPFMYICAIVLPTVHFILNSISVITKLEAKHPKAYIIGLWFTLRTHAKHIYSQGSTNSLNERHKGLKRRKAKRRKSIDAENDVLSLGAHSLLASPSQESLLGTFAEVDGGRKPEGGEQIAARTAQVEEGQSVNVSMTNLVKDAINQTTKSTAKWTIPPEGPMPQAHVMSSLPPIASGSDNHPVMKVTFRDGAPQQPHPAEENATSAVGSIEPPKTAGGHTGPNWSKSKSAFILTVGTILFSWLAG